MIEYEPMSPANVNEVWELEKICFDNPWSLKSFTNEFDNRISVYTVARDTESNRVVGYAGVWLMYDFADITNIAVAPEYRRKGLGGTMLTQLEAAARKAKCSTMTLEVRASNSSALGLYKKYGFTECGVRKNYYQNKEDAILMEKNLN